MVHQLTKADAESTNLSWHQHVGTRSRLRTTLQDTIVHGAHLIGMVREVGIRAGIIERELTTNEQRALMV